jgi:esterase/lipase superfamily enzyme
MNEQTLVAAIAAVWDQLLALAKDRQEAFEEELLKALRALEQDPFNTAKMAGVLAIIQEVPGGYDLLVAQFASESRTVTKGVSRISGAVSMERCVRVPVYYATDRAREKDSYLAQRGPLEFGRAEVSVPDVDRRGRKVGELPKPRWWRLEFRPDPEKHVILLGVTPLSVEDWKAGAKAAEALVFVHGYNVSFEDSALRAAQFVVDLNFEGTAMLYSWPSEGKMRRYRFDEGEAQWTVDDFKVFLKTVLAESGFSRVHIVAHSMGNRVVTEGIRRLDPATLPAGSAELVEAVFAAPDVDSDTFRKFAAEFHQRAGRMTLYASANDKPLSFSQKIHRYPRAGDLRDGMLISEGVDSIDISAIDTSFMGHSYFAENRSIINDLFAVIRGVKVGPDRNELKECVGPDGAKYWAVKA